ncbi:MAG: DUF3137 domain-containing protein [Halothermotrichaceae bacterium]
MFKTTKGFYNEDLKRVLNDLNDDRKIIRKKVLLYTIITAFILLFLTGLFFYYIKTIILGFLLIPASGILFAYEYFKERFGKSYVEDFKHQVLSKLVKYVDEDLEYNKDNFVDRSEFIYSALYNDKRIDRYRGEDYISGKVGKTRIEFSEVRACYKKGDEYRRIFGGLFFIADFNKDFKSKLIITPRGLLGKPKVLEDLMSGNESITMENTDFENVFDVRGTSQLEARYILTPKIMEKILRLYYNVKKSVGGHISVSFNKSKIYIAIPICKDLFEPSIMGEKYLMRKDINEFYKYIKLMFDIVEELDLNTRIWTKK